LHNVLKKPKNSITALLREKEKIKIIWNTRGGRKSKLKLQLSSLLTDNGKLKGPKSNHN
jgi:hypothetical protein